MKHTSVYAYAILETLVEVSTAPSGVLYAAFMSRGVSLDTYLTALEALQRAGAVTIVNHVVTITDIGRNIIKHTRTAVLN